MRLLQQQNFESMPHVQSNHCNHAEDLYAHVLERHRTKLHQHVGLSRPDTRVERPLSRSQVAKPD